MGQDDDLIKQEAIAYSIFKKEYQLIEGMNVRHHNMEKYGKPIAITWVGDSDDVIWQAYKKGEQLKRWIEKQDKK